MACPFRATVAVVTLAARPLGVVDNPAVLASRVITNLIVRRLAIKTPRADAAKVGRIGNSVVDVKQPSGPGVLHGLTCSDSE